MAEPRTTALDLRDPSLTAEAVAAALDLRPHLEGGRYRETWRDHPADGGRGAGTSILFLLAAGERSHWHRVDAAEGWHWQAGAPLRLEMCRDGDDPASTMLGPVIGAGQSLSAMVPAGWWQAASSCPAAGTATWSLVCCTVSPAFRFEGFEMAPPGWQPGRRG
ncbi:cupin domain-containing protein [Roseomonas elaeocarpi]|uniref:Cupin domain-containing protein n=1 Tax=Roseomonas elaeocarpi TaxID=907779 RepID=A0ABV6JX26_9PROT